MRGKKLAAMPSPHFWDDLAALETIVEDLRADLDRQAAEIRRWNTGDAADWDAYDAAEREFDAIDKELAQVRKRIVQMGGE